MAMAKGFPVFKIAIILLFFGYSGDSRDILDFNIAAASDGHQRSDNISTDSYDYGCCSGRSCGKSNPGDYCGGEASEGHQRSDNISPDSYAYGCCSGRSCAESNPGDYCGGEASEGHQRSDNISPDPYAYGCCSGASCAGPNLGDYCGGEASEGHQNNDNISRHLLEYLVSGEATPKGDIYSFGVMILEMVTGKSPSADIFAEDFNLRNWVSMYLPNAIENFEDREVMKDVEEYEIERRLIPFVCIGLECSNV